MYCNFRENDPDEDKTWFELGKEVGLEVVSDEVVEEEEEDLEVAKIYNEAKDKHREIMTGMYNLQCNACYSCRRCQRYSVQM